MDSLMMLNLKISNIRQKIHTMLSMNNGAINSDIIELSQELDSYILEFYLLNGKSKKQVS